MDQDNPPIDERALADNLESQRNQTFIRRCMVGGAVIFLASAEVGVAAYNVSIIGRVVLGALAAASGALAGGGSAIASINGT